MTQYAATIVSLAGITWIRRPAGPWLGLGGSLLWVFYGLETEQWGLALTELAFVGAYIRLCREAGA